MEVYPPFFAEIPYSNFSGIIFQKKVYRYNQFIKLEEHAEAIFKFLEK